MKSYTQKIFIIFSSVLLLFGSFTITNINAQQVTKKFSGEEIFKGITLGQGPVGEFFKNDWTSEELELNNNEITTEYTDEVLEIMKEKNSSYFDDLKDAVYSQDYVKTKELLQTGGDLFIEIVAEDATISVVEPDAALFAGLYFVAGLTTVAAASHAVWVTFYLWTAGAGPGISSGGSELSVDLAVDKLINSLN